MKMRVEKVDVRALTFPTETPHESDGTLSWDSTTMVLVEAYADGVRGIGYSYTHGAAVKLIDETLADLAVGEDVLCPQAVWERMVRRVRNFGRQGIAASAISAVDIALWDLQARVLNVPLANLLMRRRESIRVYGSGGFTNYDDAQLERQLLGWLGQEFDAVKIKIGSGYKRDMERIELARRVLGPDVALFVDANGAYRTKEAVNLANAMQALGVSWFEEPVSSDDLAAMRYCREHMPSSIDVAAGEYGWDWFHFRDLVGGVVDVAQPDATRCLGITGFTRCACLCQTFGLPISTHTAPAIHVSLACAVPQALHVEWFYDHVRIEQEVFEGFPTLAEGKAWSSRKPGLGLTLNTPALKRLAA